MRKLLAAFVVLFAGLLASQAYAATTYFCNCDTSGAGVSAYSGCVAGSDSNNGSTALLAKQSANGVTILSDFLYGAAGTQVLLCSGGAWAGVTGQGSSTATVASPTTLTSYQPSCTEPTRGELWWNGDLRCHRHLRHGPVLDR